MTIRYVTPPPGIACGMCRWKVTVVVCSPIHQSILLCGYEPVVLQTHLGGTGPLDLLSQGSLAPTEPECFSTPFSMTYCCKPFFAFLVTRAGCPISFIVVYTKTEAFLELGLYSLNKMGIRGIDPCAMGYVCNFWPTQNLAKVDRKPYW